jgi:hypothetical protein
MMITKKKKKRKRIIGIKGHKMAREGIITITNQVIVREIGDIL